MYLRALIFASCLLLLPGYYHTWTKPFRFTKFNVALPYSESWETPAEQTQILSQPFRYFGKGFQSFVFLSEDGNYVLKLFRFDHVAWIRKRPLNDARMMIDAAKISFDTLRNETGLIAVHLNPQVGKWPLIEIRDFLGFKHTLDPAETRFVLQKRAEKFYPALMRAYKEDRSRYDRMVLSFEQLLHSFEEKGVTTLDPKISRNFGFIGDVAVQIDIASNKYDNSQKQMEYLRSKFHKRCL